MIFDPFDLGNVTTLNSGISTVLLIAGIPLVIILLLLLIYEVSKKEKRQAGKNSYDEDVVRLYSKLYAEIQALNNSRRSIKGKSFSYSKTGTVEVDDYNKWQSYSVEKYLANHKQDFERDLMNLQLFIDDCTIYQDAVSKLWNEYAGNPLCVENSGLATDKFCKIEERICTAIVLPIPAPPHLKYSINIKCSSRGLSRRIVIDQSDVDAFLRRNKTSDFSYANPESETSESVVGKEQRTLGVSDKHAGQKQSNERPEEQERTVEKESQDSFFAPANNSGHINKEASNAIATVTQANDSGNDEIIPVFEETFVRYFNSIDDLDREDYFWATLNDKEQWTIKRAAQIIFLEAYWDVLPANRAESFSFRNRGPAADNLLSLFWFRKPKGSELLFCYRKDGDSLKVDFIEANSDNFAIIRQCIDAQLKYVRNQRTKNVSANSAPSNIQANEKTPKNDRIGHFANSDGISPTLHATLPKKVSFWEQPFHYTSEIMQECGMSGAVLSADISAICTLHHFTYGSGAAFNNKYRSFADAIYQSKIVNSENKIYIYTNPYNCQAYDRAIQKLLDELKLFDLGEGKYLTNKALHADHGLIAADFHDLKNKMKKYFEDHHFFTLDDIRDYCAECRFLEFYSSDRILMQFVHSIFGRGVKTMVLDQDSPKAIYSTELGEIEYKKFFVFIMENSSAMDIYTIKDRVEECFEVNYSLDLIGKDAERAGFFYSEDLEKIYKHKKDFYEEIKP